jgi:hypothetical protein
MPRAIIIVTGYYSAFSSNSSKVAIKIFLERYKGTRSSFGLGVNDLLSYFDLGIDIDAIGRAVKARSEYGHTRALHHLSRAVLEFNLTRRGKQPGVIFVNPAFGPENALFTRDCYIHQEYLPDLVWDSQKEVRRRQCPRAEYIQVFETTVENLLPSEDPFIGQEDMDWIISHLNGPKPVLQAARNGDRGAVVASIRKELERIRTCLIASFVHPNEAGAAQYARRIVERFQEYQRTGIRAEVSKLSGWIGAPPGQPVRPYSVKRSLQRYGLKPERGLRHCLQHMNIDALAVRLTTSSGKAVSTAGPIELPDEIWFGFSSGHPGEIGFLLNDEVGELTAGADDFFTMDARGSVHLGDLRGLTLKRVSHAGRAKPWTPGRIALSINRTEVFSAPIDRPVGASESINLPFPMDM